MPSIPDSHQDVSPLLTAALLLAARPHLRHHQLPCPGASAIFEATGAGRTRAYKLASKLATILPGLERPVGRPRKEPAEISKDVSIGIRDEVLDFFLTHPGCVTGTTRRRYTPSFCHAILALRERHASVPLPTFAAAVHVPEGTLHGWMRDANEPLEASGGRPSPGEPDVAGAAAPSGEPQADGDRDDATTHNGERTTLAPDEATEPRIQTVVTQFKQWEGPFDAFCHHLRSNFQISYGRTMISNILASHGLRRPARRPGRSPDEVALKKAFEAFFPGAPWVGDGHQVTITLNGEPYTFNLELNVDADSAALVGAHISDQEDSDAVIRAFHDGVETTGQAALAILLDNRPSNHTEDVNDALQGTLVIRATRGRPQNKAHVEGAFGLFEQTAPPLELWADTLHDLMAGIVRLLLQVWGRTLNHKPRRDRGNRSRVELYKQSDPTPDEIEKARVVLEKRQRQQEKAYQTLRARQNPVARKLLAKAFAELELVDPDGYVQLAIARYPVDAIVEGIATFKAKKRAGTLPEGAAARYLLGIVKNISTDNEQLHLTEQLLHLRLQARDWLLEPLRIERDVLLNHETELTARLELFVTRALATDSFLARLFWLHSAAELIQACPAHQHVQLTRWTAGRIRTTYSTTATTRSHAIRYLTRAIFPTA